jgi:hypothetical protein
MEWVAWLVPLVALVVWILANLFSVRDNNPLAGQQKPPAPREQPRVEKAREPRTDLDRFIEETRRRREQQVQHRAPSRQVPDVPVQQKAAAPVMPAVRPAAARTGQRPAPPPLPRVQPVPAIPPAPATTLERVRPADLPPLPVPATVPLVDPARDVSYAERVSKGLAAPITEQTMPAAYAQRPQGSRRGGVVTRQVVEMLRDPNSARVAFLLREILDRPVSARHGRRR